MRPAVIFGALISANMATADLANGTYAISLTGAGDPLEVAKLLSTEEGFSVEWDETLFEDAFLSMRPFRCMTGKERTLCRMPYPYENRRQITADDLTDLEYDLLFIWKPTGSYGIDFWNGMYFVLASDEAGLTGTLHELDMNILAVPPSAGDYRPISSADLHEADPASHPISGIRIAP